ncbi:MAG TPA: TIGR03915 family putative DNA repair protein [Candidatus Limivivens intestinipullorum]|uniref:TIGR03915 family putative DNA repair protein n=1 Tax=Candidatus Limivivens intestinipullorum TaxID=2840858 RepID=A0A9D1ERR9_9FIRM|nr:TIGR03915 family putative DNA repair protein [Candidatus Limivivens intestinipullorum]
MRIFLCDGIPEGILTGVYDAWASRLGHSQVRLQSGEPGDMELFAEYTRTRPDREKAEKVARTIKRELGAYAWQCIFQAALSEAPERADSIYRTVVEGLLASNKREQIMDRLQNKDIRRVFELSRRVGNEAHHYLGFLRFSELGGGILFSKIHPKARILSLIGDHFSQRFPMEHFLICDAAHEETLLHRAGHPWILTQGQALNPERTAQFSETEQEFRCLWQGFVDTIGIEERANSGLQRQLLPLRYRPDLVEKL